MERLVDEEKTVFVCLITSFPGSDEWKKTRNGNGKDQAAIGIQSRYIKKKSQFQLDELTYNKKIKEWPKLYSR